MLIHPISIPVKPSPNSGRGTQASIDRAQTARSIEHSLNNRQRKILGFQTPAEVFNDLKINDVAGVALEL